MANNSPFTKAELYLILDAVVNQEDSDAVNADCIKQNAIEMADYLRKTEVYISTLRKIYHRLARFQK